MSEPGAFALPSTRAESRFRDLKPAFTPAEARAESLRCLGCRDAPCIASCPTRIDIPTFIRKIATSNSRGSARTILEANLLGASCARVCPVEVLCEGACVYIPWGRAPIPIGRLQDFAMLTGAPGASGAALLTKSPPSGKSVGLVGGGPASLSCAGTLALAGHAATIYEKDPWPGGLNVTGVAPYKLRGEEALAEVSFIASLGVKFRTSCEVGKDISATDLLSRHDAIFLGLGLGEDAKLGIPGEEGPGVWGATAWIRRLKTSEAIPGKGVRSAVVIGGGNTSIDVTRELRRLGVARVTLVARRPLDRLKAYAHEVELARCEGVDFLGGVVLEQIVRDGDRVVGARIASSATVSVPRALEADLIVVAIGQSPLRAVAASFPGVECDASGGIVTDPRTGRTGNPKVYAGGDARNGGKEVVYAAAEGQTAAHAIDAMLRGGSHA